MTRIARVVGGFILLIAGVAMLVLPGPGVLTILGGLALIGQEFPWAQRMLDRIKAAITRVWRSLTQPSA